MIKIIDNIYTQRREKREDGELIGFVIAQLCGKQHKPLDDPTSRLAIHKWGHFKAKLGSDE